MKKVFTDGTLAGKVLRHVVLPMKGATEEAQEDDDGERWLLQFDNGKQQLVRPQELLDILVGDEGAKKKANGPLANDPYVGRQVRPPTDDDPDMGTIVRVVLKKVQGKKKRVRVYTIEWRNPQGGVEFTREYERFEFMPFLVPEGAS